MEWRAAVRNLLLAISIQLKHGDEGRTALSPGQSLEGIQDKVAKSVLYERVPHLENDATLPGVAGLRDCRDFAIGYQDNTHLDEVCRITVRSRTWLLGFRLLSSHRDLDHLCR